MIQYKDKLKDSRWLAKRQAIPRRVIVKEEIVAIT